MTVRILIGDAMSRLRDLGDDSVHAVVTSPPYFGLRSYLPESHADKAKEIGLEETPSAFVETMVGLFSEVRRVLRPDGTLWLNLGDSYAGSWGAQSRGGPPSASSTLRGNGHVGGGPKIKGLSAVQIATHPKRTHTGSIREEGLKPKDLIGIPWRTALALQADGWWLRQDIIWSKPNPMPESVTDRCTKAHEYLFMLTKSERYHFDAEAIAEPAAYPEGPGNIRQKYSEEYERTGDERLRTKAGLVNIGASDTRNKRSVWTVATQPFKEAHFATFPPALIEPCILAGCPEGGTVLDPFFGAGTTGLVADRLKRNAIGIELNPEYAAIAERRIKRDATLFADVEVAA
jgi:DNA modification methylase